MRTTYFEGRRKQAKGKATAYIQLPDRIFRKIYECSHEII